MKSHARCAVIGGGIMGTAMLYHLTRAGWSDVVLIEKGELTSGSTWHAAGQVPYFAESTLFARIQYESFESYKRLEAESGTPTGVHAVGSLRIARTEDEVREYKRYLAFARPLGIEGDLIGPNETRSLWPLLEFRDFKAALHTTGDGYTDPAQTTNAFAKAARDKGAEIYRHTRVVGIARTASGEWRIETTKGALTVEVVVNAAGFWGPEISAMVGGSLPIVAMEHEYFVTEAVPELAGAGRELPVLRDMNVPTYVRQERQGLLVACYESHPVFWGLDGIPKDFGQELFAPDIERAAPQLEMTTEMIPVLKRVGIKAVINGPTGRTADLKPCVGPAHGLPNYYTLCGAVGGFLQCGFGKYLAEWIVEGEPSLDLSAVDVRRFGAYATKAYAVAKVGAGHAYSNPVYYPHGEPSQGRLARTAPLYAAHKAKGAAFGVDNGWEVPNWFAPPGVAADDGTRFERQAWVAHAGAEARAAREAAALLDMTSRAKFELVGAAALDRLCAGRLPEAGHAAVLPFLTGRGRVATVLLVERLADDLFYAIGEAASEQRDFDWLAARLGEGGTIRNVTARDGLLWLGGPAAWAILDAVSSAIPGASLGAIPGASLGAPDNASAWPQGASRTAAMGIARARILRVDDVAEPAFVIVHPIEAQLALYRALHAAGATHALKDIGRRAYEALRIASGSGRWGADFAADCSPGESALAHRLAPAKGAFLGKAALEAPDTARHRLVRLDIAANGAEIVDPWGGEPVFADGRAAGVVTSASFAPSLAGSVALARLDARWAKPGTRLEVEILGERRAAVVVDRAI